HQQLKQQNVGRNLQDAAVSCVWADLCTKLLAPPVLYQNFASAKHRLIAGAGKWPEASSPSPALQPIFGRS
ncbi:hypothetical protein HAX54_037192, partial [Datura stramonium]|nr:hypothetical protein [Datura stramonium]